jgi:hypothetical protein
VGIPEGLGIYFSIISPARVALLKAVAALGGDQRRGRII